MKPDAVLGGSPILVDASAATTYGMVEVPESYTETKIPKLNFANIDKILQKAKDNGLKMRGHTLVWHSQTPSWFFKTDYSASGSYVSKAIMQKRMENYIKQVMYHVYTNYSDVVYCWDVVNEAFDEDGTPREPGDNNTSNGKSCWVQTYGDNSFVRDAFTYARKYSTQYSPDFKVKLFYNDYNEYITDKMNAIYNMASELKQAQLIDGIGMQSHWATHYPTVDNVETAIKKYKELGLEIHLTEVDMTISSGYTVASQAQIYKNMMQMLMKYKENVSCVTFWGLSDDVSWRASQNPLIFKKNLQPKQAYYEIMSLVE